MSTIATLRAGQVGSEHTSKQTSVDIGVELNFEIKWDARWEGVFTRTSTGGLGFQQIKITYSKDGEHITKIKIKPKIKWQYNFFEKLNIIDINVPVTGSFTAFSNVGAPSSVSSNSGLFEIVPPPDDELKSIANKITPNSMRFSTDNTGVRTVLMTEQFVAEYIRNEVLNMHFVISYLYTNPTSAEAAEMGVTIPKTLDSGAQSYSIESIFVYGFPKWVYAGKGWNGSLPPGYDIPHPYENYVMMKINPNIDAITNPQTGVSQALRHKSIIDSLVHSMNLGATYSPVCFTGRKGEFTSPWNEELAKRTELKTVSFISV